MFGSIHSQWLFHRCALFRLLDQTRTTMDLATVEARIEQSYRERMY
jgi:hypothetical protein